MQIERPTYLQQLIDSKDNGLIKIITGLRRVGKSYLLKTLFKKHLLNEGIKKDHVLIIDLEDRKYKNFRNPDYLLDWVDKQMVDDEQYVCNLGSRRYYLQSAFRMPDEEKMEQEKRSLKQIGDAFKKMVIVGERMQLRRDDFGIVMTGIFEFLFDPKIIDA